MKALFVFLLALVPLALVPAVQAQDGIRTVDVRFDRGASSAVVEGSITGYDAVDYRLGATAGQRMHVLLYTDHSANYFNVLPPGSQGEAIFIGSSEGNEWSGTLEESGVYTVRVYLMRSAARRGETADYSVEFSITGSGSPSTSSASQPESDCLAAVGEQVGIASADLTVLSAEMGETFTTVLVQVPGAQAPWQCNWGYTDGRPGVLETFFANDQTIGGGVNSSSAWPSDTDASGMLPCTPRGSSFDRSEFSMNCDFRVKRNDYGATIWTMRPGDRRDPADLMERDLRVLYFASDQPTNTMPTDWIVNFSTDDDSQVFWDKVEDNWVVKVGEVGERYWIPLAVITGG